jgi:hypothetical protein
MTSPATAFVDDAAVAARAAEIPAASFANGVNVGGSCASGIGINMLEGAIVGTPEQFTLDDQFENPRVPQIGQAIGGYPFVDRDPQSGGYIPQPSSGGTPGTTPDGAMRYGDSPDQASKDADSDLDGTITFTSNCTLNDIATGWEAAAP